MQVELHHHAPISELEFWDENATENVDSQTMHAESHFPFFGPAAEVAVDSWLCW